MRRETLSDGRFEGWGEDEVARGPGRTGPSGVDIDKSEMDGTGVTSDDDEMYFKEGRPAGCVYPSRDGEGDGPDEEHPLAERRHGLRRNRLQTFISKGSRASLRIGHENCTFCRHGPNTALRVVSTFTKGCGRCMCKSLTVTGRPSPKGEFSWCRCSQVASCMCDR